MTNDILRIFKRRKQANLILEADDEKEILSILENEEFSPSNDFKSKFNLLRDINIIILFFL